ncbi:MAG: NirD/YgiW/YdeI family stress tolerance protein [Xenococcaceae cyanobacterium]
MTKIKIISALIVLGSLFSLETLAQTQMVTIASILNYPVDGREVTLTGRIIDQESEEKDYIFTDGSDQITIELQNAGFSYNPDVTVKISGIVNLESEHLEKRAEDPTPERIEIEVSKVETINLNN